MNKIEQSSQTSDEANNTRVQQAKHSPARPCSKPSRNRKSCSFLALTVALVIAGWVGSQRQSPTRGGIDTNDTAAAKLVKRADQHVSQKQLESAIVDLNAAVRLKRRDSKLYWRRALVYEQLGEFARCREDCEKVVELPAVTVEEHTISMESKKLRRRCLEKILKFDAMDDGEAITRLSHEIGTRPTAERLRRRADLYNLSSRMDLAAADLNEAVQLEPDNFEILSQLAMTQHDLGRYSEAANDYSKIVEWPDRFDKRDVCWALDERAECYRQLKKFDWAVADERASNELRIVASGKIEFEKFIPFHYRRTQHDPLEQGICAAVKAVPNIFDLVPSQICPGLTLAIDESIVNPDRDQFKSDKADMDGSSKANANVASSTDAMLYKLSKYADCESLDLTGTPVTDIGLKCLAGKKLKRLKLDRTNISAKGIENLGLQPELTSLSLDSDDCINDVLIENLRQFPKLTFLSLRNTKIRDQGIKLLPETAPRLENLYVQGDNIGDNGLPAVARLRSLVYFDLDHTNITGKTLEKLSALQHLRYLDLSCTHSLQRRYLMELLQRQPALFELYLTEDQVDDSAIPLIASMKELRRLDLGFTRVTTKGFGILARSSTKLRSIAEFCIPSVLSKTGMFCDEHNIAAIKRQHKSIAIAGGFMLSEDFWPAVLNDPDQQ